MNVYDRKMKNVNELRIIGISPPPCGRPSSQGWKQASPAQPGRVLLLSGAASAKAWRRQAALHGRHEPAPALQREKRGRDCQCMLLGGALPVAACGPATPQASIGQACSSLWNDPGWA